MRIVPVLAAALVVAALTPAPALAAATVTPKGVGAVKLGATYTSLRARGLVGELRPGCELGGPNTRSAVLRAPLEGSIDFTLTTPRKARTISISGGAEARGVGIGDSAADVRRAYPKAVFNRSVEDTFLATFVKAGPKGGGPLAFAISTRTKQVTQIAVPNLALCE